jgi:hypothetical protein
MPAAKKRKATTNLKQFVAPGSKLRGCNRCDCHLPYYLQSLQEKISAATEKVTSLTNTNQIQNTTINKLNDKLQETNTKNAHLINKLNEKLQETNTKYAHLLKESKTIQYELSTTKQLLASSKNQLQRHLDTSPVLVRHVNDLKSQTSQDKRALAKLTEKLELSEADVEFKSHQILTLQSQVKDTTSEKSQLSLSHDMETQAVLAKFRNYQVEQARKVTKLKSQLQASRQRFSNYLKPVKQHVLSGNQVHRLTSAVSTYMADRQFSEDQQSAVISRLAENSSPGSISKYQKARLSLKLGQKQQIQLYLTNSNPEHCETLLPPSTVKVFERRGAQNFVDQLYTHWNLALCAHLKFTLKLSRRQWDMIRRTFFQRYDQKLGWCPLWINGVRMSQPFSHHKLKQWIREVAGMYDLQEILDGQTAIVDLDVSISMMLSKECNSERFQWIETRWGDVQLESKLNQTRPILVISFDAARSLKHRQTTAVSWRLANGSPMAHKPQYTHTVAVSDGNDEHEHLTAQLGSMFDYLNRVLNRCTVDIQTEYRMEQVAIACVACADQKAVHSNYGMGPCKAKFSCPYCHCQNTDFQNPDDQSEIRTIQLIKLLSHTVEGHCPACDLLIVDKKAKDCEEGETPVAKPGMKPPKVPEKFATFDNRRRRLPTWLELHFNIIYGTTILLEIEPCMFAICILHLNLRVVGALLFNTMFKHLGTGVKGDKKGEKLWNLLLKVGIPIKKIKGEKKGAPVDWYQTVKKHSFAGADAARMLLVWKDSLDIVFPVADIEKDNILESQKLSYVQCWTQYSGIWSLLNNLDIHKDQKADLLDIYNRQFCDTWRRAIGSTATLYLHLLFCHVPKQLRDLPIDLWFLQTQGLEHCNYIRKQFARLLSNGHKCEREIAVSGYTTRYGTVVDDHVKSSGPGLSYQLLESTVVWEHVKSLMENTEGNKVHSLETKRSLKLKLNKAAVEKETKKQIADFSTSE